MTGAFSWPARRRAGLLLTGLLGWASWSLLAACSAQSTGGDGDGEPPIQVGDGDSGDGDQGDGDGAGPGDGDSTIDLGDGDLGDGDMGDGDSMDPEEDCDATLELIVRDFNADHPDMQRTFAGRDDVACGMVLPNLLVTAENARTPQFFGPIGTGQRRIENLEVTCLDWGPMAPAPDMSQYEIESEATFNQWFSDVEGVNSTFMVTLPLTATNPADPNTTYVYDSEQSEGGRFFPADGQGFNELVDSQGSKHNFHFTTEAHVKFGYEAGGQQRFAFSGDDDMWIFVNGRLALDLGGLHNKLEARIDFDEQASALGLTGTGTYSMDIFHAERRTDESNYRVETNINCFENVVVHTEVIR